MNVSEEFENAFSSHSGGCVRVCQCNRTHYDISDNGWDWADGELDGLKEKTKKNPDLFIPQDGTICTMTINGVEVVMGCKCNFAESYELFIKKHSEQIARYLNSMAKEFRRKAKAIEVK